MDAGSGTVTVTLSAPSGALAASSGGVTVGGTPPALTLTGTLADLNAFFSAAKVSYLAASGATGDVPLTATLSDQGNVGAGGAQQDVATVTLDLPDPSPPPSNEQTVIVGGLPITVRENVGPGGGGDTLLGDRGDDTLAGEAGADRFIVFADGGRDVIADFDAAAGTGWKCATV